MAVEVAAQFSWYQSVFITVLLGLVSLLLLCYIFCEFQYLFDICSCIYTDITSYRKGEQIQETNCLQGIVDRLINIYIKLYDILFGKIK